MEAKAMIEEMKKIGPNDIAVRISVSISNVHLKLVDKNDKDTTRKNTARYSFVLTVLEHKFRMAPDENLGECMEIHDHHPTCAGLTPYQQNQWCVGALTNRIINRLIETELLRPFSLGTIPGGDEEEDEGENGFPLSDEEVDSLGEVKDRLRDIKGSIGSLVEMLDGMLGTNALLRHLHSLK
jgi:hypothetical protein